MSKYISDITMRILALRERGGGSGPVIWADLHEITSALLESSERVDRLAMDVAKLKQWRIIADGKGK